MCTEEERRELQEEGEKHRWGSQNSPSQEEETLLAEPFPSQGRKEKEPAAGETFNLAQATKELVEPQEKERDFKQLRQSEDYTLSVLKRIN